MARQGRPLSDAEVRRIAELLSATDLTIAEIATRMGRARSAVRNVNRRLEIRTYSGRRTKWTKGVRATASGND